MSCEICRGHRGCPCCTPETPTRECSACGGKGYRWYAFDIRTRRELEVTETVYEMLPDSEDAAAWLGVPHCKGDKEPCDVCDGTGRIVDDLIPEYEPYE